MPRERKKKIVTAEIQIQEKKTRKPLIAVLYKSTSCPHCGFPDNFKVGNSYKNGNKRVVCCACNKPFMLIKRA